MTGEEGGEEGEGEGGRRGEGGKEREEGREEEEGERREEVVYDEYVCPHLNVSWCIRLGTLGRCPVLWRLGEVLSDEPGESRPTLEVDNVIFALLLRKASRCDLTGERHCDSETAQEEPHLLATRVLGEGER